MAKWLKYTDSKGTSLFNLDTASTITEDTENKEHTVIIADTQAFRLEVDIHTVESALTARTTIKSITVP